MILSTARRAGLIGLALGVLPASAGAAEVDAARFRPLAECVPADAMAALFGRPTPEMIDAGAGRTLDQIAGWLVTFKAMGLIRPERRVITDVIATMPLLSRRPHAWILMDITSRQIGPDEYRLNDMHAALVVDGEGLSDEIDRRVRDLLATYTDAATGRIEECLIGDVRYHELTDRRLPDWVKLAWGEIGRQFVLTLGHGTFARMVDVLQGRDRVLADNPWFARAHERCRGATSGIEIYVDLTRISGRVGEVVKDRPGQVVQAMGLADVQRLVWTVGFDDRALCSQIMARDVHGQDLHRALVGPEVTAPEVTAAIPPAAAGYAAFRLPLPAAVRGWRQAYLESQSPSTRNRLLDGWARLEAEFGFDVATGLIDRLGEHLVFHTYPPHPLDVPILCTIWIQYTGDRQAVADTVDRIMTAWQHHARGPTDTQPAAGFSPRVVHGNDGIWYLQLGIIAPAVAVADGWIIISYSPQAVRANLAHIDTLD